MRRKIKFTPTADKHYTALEVSPASAPVFEQVRKAIGYLELDPQPPGLQTHEFTSLAGPSGEKVYEAYAQYNTPGGYRIFWRYGPDEVQGKKRIPVITILAIPRHPSL
jgi:hypothetical protein